MMKSEQNAAGQSLGEAIPSWRVPPLPPRTPIEGRYCRLEPLEVERHAEQLFEAYALDRDGSATVATSGSATR